MILAEGARLKKVGEKGLEILPGVQTLLDSVCGAWQVKDLADGSERRYRKMRGRSSLRVSHLFVRLRIKLIRHSLI